MAIRIITPPPKAEDMRIGVPEDMARGGVTGLVEGITAIPGALGDIRQLGQYGQDKIAEWMGHKGERPLGPLQAPLPMQVLSEVGASATKKIGGDPRLARSVMALMFPGAALTGSSSAEIQGAVTKDKPLYQPHTVPGQYTRTVAQFAPATLAPGGGLVRRLASAVVPALASETAGQVTKGGPMEPWAQMVAALGAGGLTAITGRGGADTRLLAEASRPASEGQIAAARALMEQGQQRGVRLTMAEALQQVTEGATGMGRLQRVVEGTRAGSERTGPVMAQRPAQVRQAVTGYADTIAPPTTQPGMLGAQAQETAATALNGVRQGINAQAQPHYDRLQRYELGRDVINPLYEDPAYLQASQRVRSDPILGPPLEHLGDGNPAFVNEVVKWLDNAAEGARPGPMNPGGNNQLTAAYTRAAANARDVMETFIPDWTRARQTVAQGRAANLEPLQRGPLGAISATNDLGAQTRSLFPTQPAEGAASETAQALQMMGGRTNDQARGLVRQQLVNTANEATQDLQGGPNQWGGATWAAQQMGNPEQAATLRSGVGAVGGNVPELNDLVAVLRATGQRQRPGSMTAYNARDLEELGNAGMTGEALRTGLNPPGVFRRIGQGFQNWQTERNAGRLAEAILASPAEAEQILLHARAIGLKGDELATISRLAIAARMASDQQIRQLPDGR